MSLPNSFSSCAVRQVCAQGCDYGVGERALSILQCNHGGENFLLVLHNEHIGLQHALDGADDFMGCQPVGTLEDLHGLDHRHNAEEELTSWSSPSTTVHSTGRRACKLGELARLDSLLHLLQKQL
jgi:hypothetical protein